MAMIGKSDDDRTASRLEDVVMFRKIFCPVDLSENSVKALQWTEFLARKYSSEVVILHVIESLQANPVVDLDYPQIQTAAVTAVREFLAPVNVPYESMLSSGHPAHKITSLAEAVNADLIVMGTRGLRGMSHVFLGSTTERVVRTSSLPVFTITPECAMPGDLDKDNLVLVPIPTLQQVPRGYLKIRSILKHLHAMPTLMHVVRGGDAPAIPTPEVRSASQVLSYEYTEMKQSLLKIGARITNYAEEVHAVIRFGQVAEEILKELKTGSYSYLVMAVRKRGLLPAFIESTAYQILSLAPVPVLTVKKGE
ncbi:MAG TPA: universal stress protein [Acidobacteriota bacterium]|nr:universal stress protein [Acidobacteriota bacterium]